MHIYEPLTYVNLCCKIKLCTLRSVFGVGMTKIVFCFAGTGDNGDGYAKSLENNSNFQEDVIRVYFRGCQHSEVANGFVFPDLDSAAIKIRKAFEGNQFDLDQLKQDFGDGICLVEAPSGTTKVEVESIGLQGFSRGAVTTFAAAKRLDDLGVPIDIIANQPVPGQMAGDTTASSIYSKFYDLSQCKNIRTATTFLASHNLENGFFHNQFFQQMIAKFPPNVKANNWIMPHQFHLAWFRSPLIPMHINIEFAKLGYAYEDYSKETIIRHYKSSDLYFTPKEFAQNIFGQDNSIKKDPVYLEFIKDEAKKHLSAARSPSAPVEEILNKFKNFGLKKESESEVDEVILTDDQASAIVAISKIGLDQETQKNLMEFVLANTPESEKYIKIVNKVHDTCEYLSYVTKDGESEDKSAKIVEHSVNYKQAIFVESYNYMSKTGQTKQDKEDFVKNIKNAEKIFEANATGIDRGIMRKAMKVLVNTILHLTGLFLIVNTLNAALTGNYFFFNNTRSSQVVKNTSDEVIDLLDKKVPGTETPDQDKTKKNAKMDDPIQDPKQDNDEPDREPQFKR